MRKPISFLATLSTRAGEHNGSYLSGSMVKVVSEGARCSLSPEEDPVPAMEIGGLVETSDSGKRREGEGGSRKGKSKSDQLKEDV